MLMNIVLEQVEKYRASRVLSVSLMVGELAGIEEEDVRFYFDVLSQGTKARGADLKFQVQKAVFKCKTCGRTYGKKDSGGFLCPYCGQRGYLAEKGADFYIKSIEVE